MIRDKGTQKVVGGPMYNQCTQMKNKHRLLLHCINLFINRETNMCRKKWQVHWFGGSWRHFDV